MRYFKEIYTGDFSDKHIIYLYKVLNDNIFYMYDEEHHNWVRVKYIGSWNEYSTIVSGSSDWHYVEVTEKEMFMVLL